MACFVSVGMCLLYGAITALITPFNDDGEVSFVDFEKFVEWQIMQGIHGLVPCGSTGEALSLTEAERLRLCSICVTKVKDCGSNIPVIAGIPSNNTDQVIRMVKQMEKIGVDAVLIATPFYNKPSQEGIYQHFKAVNDSVPNMKIVAYDIPSRSCTAISDEALVKVAKLNNVIAIKDATANVTRPVSLSHMVPDDFVWLSGDDNTSLAFNLHGGSGCISVMSNVVPKQFSEMQNASNKKDYDSAMHIYRKLFDLKSAIESDTNPVTIKYAVSCLDLCGQGVRMPLMQPSDELKSKIMECVTNLQKNNYFN